jgi:hypothetical protein
MLGKSKFHSSFYDGDFLPKVRDNLAKMSQSEADFTSLVIFTDETQERHDFERTPIHWNCEYNWNL